jgi:hypothetical protein
MALASGGAMGKIHARAKRNCHPAQFTPNQPITNRKQTQRFHLSSFPKQVFNPGEKCGLG